MLLKSGPLIKFELKSKVTFELLRKIL